MNSLKLDLINFDGDRYKSKLAWLRLIKMSNDVRGFISRLIHHYDAGRVNRSSMSKIFDAEGFSEEDKSSILGPKNNILMGGKFELFGFLIILSAWLIILGVWFFSELVEIEILGTLGK